MKQSGETKIIEVESISDVELIDGLKASIEIDSK